MLGFALVTAISIATTLAAVGLSRFTTADGASSVIAPGLAAGVMVWIALAEVAPDAAGSLGWTPTVAALGGGALLVGLVTRLARRPAVAAGVAPVIGVALVLHDLPEGFALGAILSSAGLIAAVPIIVAVAAHNVPEKLAFVGPARAEGASLLPVFAAATLPEPLGAALAGAGALAAPAAVEVAVAVAGGMMLAVAAGTLPTLAHRAQAWRPFLGAGAAGVMSMAALGLVTAG